MKIANKISLSFLITALVLTGITAPISYVIIKSNLEGAIFEHLKTTAQSRAQHIKTFLKQRKVKVELMAESFLIGTILEAIARRGPDSATYVKEANSELKKILKTEVDAEEIFILDSEGKVVASTDENHIGLDKSTDAMCRIGINVTSSESL